MVRLGWKPAPLVQEVKALRHKYREFQNDGADLKNLFQTNHTRQKHILHITA
jgi:hypothetical protein